MTAEVLERLAPRTGTGCMDEPDPLTNAPTQAIEHGAGESAAPCDQGFPVVASRPRVA